MRRSLLLGLVCLAASASAQVRPDAGRDPLTAEPFLFATDAEALATPPEDGAAMMGGLSPVVHLASGATKLVRHVHPGYTVYHDGADLVLGLATVASTGGVLQPPTFSEFGRYRLPATPSDAAVVGERIYVALRKSQGVLILDASAAGWTLVGQIPNIDALAVAVSGTTVYVGRGAAGVSAYDVSLVHTPVLLGSVDTPGSANGLALSGTLLAVADGNVASGPDVRLYDVSTPGVFAPLGTAEMDGFATYVAFHDGRLYATGDVGLRAFDVTDPSAPSVLGTAPAGGETTYEVAFSGTTAYVAGLAGLHAVDVSAPAPTASTSWDGGGQYLSVAVPVAVFVPVADRFGGLQFVDMRATPTASTRVPNGGFSFRGTFDSRGYLYVTDLAGGLRIIDTRSLGTAAEIARVDLPGNTQEVLVVEQPAGTFRAFVTDADGPDSGLSVVDVTDPATPTLVGTVAVGPGYGMATDEFGEALFVASGFAGLRSYDVAGATPVLLDTYDVGANAVDVASDNDGGFGYVATFGGGMTVIYIADPANLSLLSAQTGWGFLNAVEVDPGVPNGSRLLAADGQSGLRLVDATNAANLATYSLHPTASQARDVAGRDGLGFTYVYVAEDFTGMRRFRVEALTNEVSLAGTFVSADRGIGVTVRPGGAGPDDDRTIALMAGEAGVYLFDGGYVLPSTEPGAASARLAIEAVWPNPARAAARLRYRLDAPGDATVEVLDMLGRRVAVAADGAHAAGTHTATVDARPLAPGVYVVRLTQGEGMATARLVVGR